MEALQTSRLGKICPINSSAFPVVPASWSRVEVNLFLVEVPARHLLIICSLGFATTFHERFPVCYSQRFATSNIHLFHV